MNFHLQTSHTRLSSFIFQLLIHTKHVDVVFYTQSVAHTSSFSIFYTMRKAKSFFFEISNRYIHMPIIDEGEWGRTEIYFSSLMNPPKRKEKKSSTWTQTQSRRDVCLADSRHMNIFISSKNETFFLCCVVSHIFSSFFLRDLIESSWVEFCFVEVPEILGEMLQHHPHHR